MKGKATIPENWKAPIGPYREAPPEFGGGWWVVNPFNSFGTTGNHSPWERLAPQAKPEALPAGFVDIFGPKPEFADFPNSASWTTARNHWAQNLRQFKGAGRPL